jgi:hypothetical protein
MGLECGLEHRVGIGFGLGDSVPYDFPANAQIVGNNI